MQISDTEVFGIIGDDGFQRLIAAFYRQVPADEILGPLYEKHELEDAQWRLREFLVGRFGGPQRYVEQRGHPRLRMRHARFAIDVAARDRWLKLMSAAMVEAKFPPEVSRMLHDYFADTATFLINQPG